MSWTSVVASVVAMISYLIGIPELEYPKYEENEESCEIYYDSPTITTLPAGYKPYNYRNTLTKR